MIENLSVRSNFLEKEKKFQLDFSWHWVPVAGDTSSSQCWVFCHGVSEEEVLDASCFQSSEIIRWYSTRYLNLYEENNRKFLEEVQHFNRAKGDSTRLSHCSMRDNITCFHKVEFDADYSAKVFVISIFNENETVKRTLVYSRDQSDVDFRIERQAPQGLGNKLKDMFRKALGGDDNNDLVLKILTNDTRRKVLICRTNGGTTYSIIPSRCNELYFSDSIDEKSVEIAYLVSLIQSNIF